MTPLFTGRLHKQEYFLPSPLTVQTPTMPDQHFPSYTSDDYDQMLCNKSLTIAECVRALKLLILMVLPPFFAIFWIDTTETVFESFKYSFEKKFKQWLKRLVLNLFIKENKD